MLNKACIILLFFTSFLNFAGKSQDFEVSPVQIQFNAAPGETQLQTLTIKNHDNKNTHFNIKLEDFMISSDGEKISQPGGTTKNTLYEWLNFSQGTVDLQPNAEAKITITLQVPIDNTSSRWGVIYVRPVFEKTAFGSDKGLGSTGLNISPMIAIYVVQTPQNLSGNLVKVRDLKEITIKTDTERKFLATIENIGEVITQCKIYLVAANLTTAEEKIYPPTKVEIYPQTSKEMTLSLPKDLPVGKYSLSAIVDFGSQTTLEGMQILIEVK